MSSSASSAASASGSGNKKRNTSSNNNASSASATPSMVDINNNKRTTASTASAAAAIADIDELEFDDPYEDELEEEDIIQPTKSKSKSKTIKQSTNTAAASASTAMTDNVDGEADEDGDSDSEEIIDADNLTPEQLAAAEAEAEAAETAKKTNKFVWRPSDGLTAEEQLDYDSTAYTLLHRLKVEWPCLSFDILPDSLGHFRTRFPATLYMVAGSQADRAENNKVSIYKLSDLHRTKHDDNDDDSGSDSDSDSDNDDLDDDPIIEERSFAHQGAINRIRHCPTAPQLIATMADTGKVHIWNISSYVSALDQPPATALKSKHQPLYTFTGHSTEGYALAWSKRVNGRLLTGDNNKNIYLWQPNEGLSEWTVDNKSAGSYIGHSNSIEDLQWSPSEDTVFASCSSDKTIRIWDTRLKSKSAAWIAAHKADVNVISWNQSIQHLLVSGGDDGQLKVWDLRSFKSNTPAAQFKWHTGAITSVQWHPTEESILTASSEDNSISIWDMSLETDSDELKQYSTGATVNEELPPQLFMVHQGQTEIKEVQFHSQITSLMVSTAKDGFNIFKPANME